MKLRRIFARANAETVRVPFQKPHTFHSQEIHPKTLTDFPQIEIVHSNGYMLWSVSYVFHSYSHSTSSFQFQFTTFQPRVFFFKANPTQAHTHTHKLKERKN